MNGKFFDPAMIMLLVVLAMATVGTLYFHIADKREERRNHALDY